MYDQLQSDHYCFRRLNATHQFGCTSNPGGNIGILWLMSTEQDFDHILKAGPTPPYIAVLTQKHFSTDNLIKFKRMPERVSGVVLLKMNESIAAFSPDSIHPNQYFGLYTNDTNKQAWQHRSAGSDMQFHDFPFPIFLITDRPSVEAISKCAKHNQGTGFGHQAEWPLCGAQLDSFMLASKNSISCLLDYNTVDKMFQSNTIRCRYLSRPNLFSYYKPEVTSSGDKNQLVGNRSIVLLIARLDSMSMFKDYSPGADSPTTAIISILAIADALVKKARNTEAVQLKDRNIAFALFNAESLDYTGSGKAVVDMMSEAYPKHPLSETKNSSSKVKNMHLRSIDYIVELTQLATYTQNSNLYIHTDPKNVNISRAKIHNAKHIFHNSEHIHWADESMPLPPASSQIFLKYDQEIAALVVSNHEKEFTNMYYNSIFDSPDNIFRTGMNITQQVNHLATISTEIAQAVFELAFGQTSESIQVDATFVEELLTCYLVNANCTFFNEVYPANAFISLPEGGLNSFDDQVQRKMTQMSLAYILGEKIRTLNLTQCKEEAVKNSAYSYEFVKGDSKKGLCLRSQTFETAAISPAWYDLKNGTNMREFSAWALSETNIRRPVRIFYQSSPSQDWITFSFGLVVVLLSFSLINFGFNKLFDVAVDM